MKTIEQLKQKYTIQDIAIRLGCVIREQENKTIAISCFNKNAHKNGDKHPSLVLFSEANRFECKTCGVKGDIIDLVEGFRGCTPKEAIEFIEPGFYTSRKEVTADAYWEATGINDEMKNRFRISVTERSVMLKLKNGIKYRNFSLKEAKYVNPAGDAGIFKAQNTATIPRRIIQTEGELKAIRLFQETGYPVWSGTAGAGTFKQEWVKEYDGVEKIYLLYDTDNAGILGTKKAAEMLGLNRCYIVPLPSTYKDIMDYLQDGHVKEDIDELLKHAQPASGELLLKNVVRYKDMTEEQLRAVEKREKMKIGVQRMNEGELNFHFPAGFYTVAGRPGGGKTWFALHIIRHAFKLYQKQSAFFTLEMTEEQLRARALQSWSNLTQDEYESDSDMSEGIALFNQEPYLIYDFNNPDNLPATPENFKKLMEEFYKLGRRIFLFDHIHNIPGMSDESQASKLSDKWSLMFHEVSVLHPDCWFFVFAQPTKSASRSIAVLKEDDIRYATTFRDRTDFFLSLNRKIKVNVDTGEEVIDDADKEIILYLGKSRFAPVNNVGWKLILDETGNFIDPGETQLPAPSPDVDLSDSYIEAENTGKDSTTTSDINEAKAPDNQDYSESTKQEANYPALFFGGQAITVLRTENILDIRDTSCPKPFQTSKDVKQLWTKSEYGDYQWVSKRGVKCGSVLFYKSNNSNEIFCVSCRPFDNTNDISAWYQTTQCNQNMEESYRFTYAEKEYWDSKLNKSG